MNKHKVFVSYHHENDHDYRLIFEKFSEQWDIMDSYAVKPGEIGNIGTERVSQEIRENHLKNSTVTVVLIGRDTWRRKHVDSEIYDSLRDTSNSSRSGIIGIILPSYSGYNRKKFNPRTIPKRLAQNLANQYASIHFWSNDPTEIKKWVHEAYQKRNTILPNNSMPRLVNNQKGEEWS